MQQQQQPQPQQQQPQQQQQQPQQQQRQSKLQQAGCSSPVSSVEVTTQVLLAANIAGWCLACSRSSCSRVVSCH
jgi:hypothetical protein